MQFYFDIDILTILYVSIILKFISEAWSHNNLPDTLSGLLGLPTNLLGRIFELLPLNRSKIPGINLIYIQHAKFKLQIA